MTRPRLEFTAATKRAAYARSGGICECHRVAVLHRPRSGCGMTLGAGNVFYEHIIPDNIRCDDSNSLDNCAVLCRTCWREKTDRYDRKVIAKTNHSRDRACGIARQPKGRPLPGTHASGWKHHMAGGWQRRGS